MFAKRLIDWNGIMVSDSQSYSNQLLVIMELNSLTLMAFANLAEPKVSELNSSMLILIAPLSEVVMKTLTDLSDVFYLKELTYLPLLKKI